MNKVWFYDVKGQWDYVEYSCVGETLLDKMEDLAKQKNVEPTKPMFVKIIDVWYRVSFFMRSHVSDGICDGEEVPEVIRMKTLLLGD